MTHLESSGKHLDDLCESLACGAVVNASPKRLATNGGRHYYAVARMLSFLSLGVNRGRDFRDYAYWTEAIEMAKRANAASGPAFSPRNGLAMVSVMEELNETYRRTMEFLRPNFEKLHPTMQPDMEKQKWFKPLPVVKTEEDFIFNFGRALLGQSVFKIDQCRQLLKIYEDYKASGHDPTS